MLGKGEKIGIADLPPELHANSHREISLDEAIANRYTLKNLEREYIRKVLHMTGGNKTEAANILGRDSPKTETHS